MGIQTQPIGNRDTGVPWPDKQSPSNSYAGTEMNPGDKASIQSPSFAPLQQPRTLRFRTYEATQNMQLKACTNGKTNCPFSTTQDIKPSDLQWQQAELPLPQGTQQVCAFLLQLFCKRYNTIQKYAIKIFSESFRNVFKNCFTILKLQKNFMIKPSPVILNFT